MAEYKVTINATPSKAKVISVSPKNVQNTITASPDTSLYYSNLSKKWATEMDGMVNGEDYSSKYYANVSAENAQISQTNAQACEDARVLLQGEYNEYSEGLNTAFEGLESEANAIVSAGKTDIQNTATSAKNTAISAIQTQQTTSVNAVKTEGTTQVNLAKAQATAAANSATQASNVVKQVEDDLESKVDIDDMVEVDFADAGSYIAGCAMPSNTKIDLTLGASGASYIAPANGYFAINKIATAASQMIAINVPGNWNATSRLSKQAADGVAAWCPVKKGQEITIVYDTGGSLNYFRFIYAVGSEGEV